MRKAFLALFVCFAATFAYAAEKEIADTQEDGTLSKLRSYACSSGCPCDKTKK